MATRIFRTSEDEARYKEAQKSLDGILGACVAQLEESHAGLRGLCGEILATIKVNRQRGTLVARRGDEDLGPEFDAIVEKFEKRLEHFQGGD